jgi:DNA (cytosine-5)-methyltransferase 1
MLSDGISADHPALAECCEFLNIEPGSKQAKKLVAGLGYAVEHRELRACDYGAPTIRKRFFMVMRCDGPQFVWPEQTHGIRKQPRLNQVSLNPGERRRSVSTGQFRARQFSTAKSRWQTIRCDGLRGH